MNIGQVGGNGGIDRNSDRPTRINPQHDARNRADGSDQAAISANSREAAAAFDAFVSAAAADFEPERSDEVARTVERLISGELDSEAVYRDVAERLLGNDFRAI